MRHPARYRRIAAAALAATTLATGCQAHTADYSSLATTSPRSTEETSAANPTPIAQYLSGLGVTGEQLPLDELTDITVALPRPPGWSTYDNPNFSPGTEAIAKNNNYPTALVMVFKLDGNFDVAAALQHAGLSAACLLVPTRPPGLPLPAASRPGITAHAYEPAPPPPSKNKTHSQHQSRRPRRCARSP